LLQHRGCRVLTDRALDTKWAPVCGRVKPPRSMRAVVATPSGGLLKIAAGRALCNNRQCNNVQSCGGILPPSIKGSGGGDRLGGMTTVRRHPLRPQLRIVAGATMSDFRGQEPRCPWHSPTTQAKGSTQLYGLLTGLYGHHRSTAQASSSAQLSCPLLQDC